MQTHRRTAAVDTDTKAYHSIHLHHCMQVMPHIASMGIYVVKADAMRKLLMEAYPNANDFGSEVIPGAVELGMRVQVCTVSWICIGASHLICSV